MEHVVTWDRVRTRLEELAPLSKKSKKRQLCPLSKQSDEYVLQGREILCDKCEKTIVNVGYHFNGIGLDLCDSCFIEQRESKTVDDLSKKLLASAIRFSTVLDK